MNQAIKPIETLYNGYRFRSRLEARWAVFFGRLSIAYEYENEGFEVGEGVRYLPDFWLPAQAFHVYVEVKAAKDLLTIRDLEKIYRFAVDGDNPLVLIVGSPGSQEMYLISRWSFDGWDSFVDNNGGDEAQMLSAFWSDAQDARIEIGYRLTIPEGTTLGLVWSGRPRWAFMIDEALTTARQARFEHGEKGAR